VTGGGIHDVAHGFERAAGRHDSGRTAMVAAQAWHWFEAAVARAAKTAGWGTPVRYEVRHSQRLDLDGPVDRVLSTSFLAALPEDRQRGIARDIRALASGDEVDVRYATEVYAVRRT
jgi:hypothetical protein